MAKSPTQKMFADEKKPTRKKATKKKVEETEIEQVEENVQLGSAGNNILDLPSNGKLWYDKTIEYREIMVGDEEILTSATANTYARTLNAVIKGVLNDYDKYEELTVYDRDYIIVWLWANNYDPVKDITIKCGNPKCAEVSDHKVNLTKLEITDVKDNIVSPFPVKLSRSSMKEIQIRLNTVQDELNVEAYMEANPKSNFSMLMLVSSIDIGFDMSLEKKLEWVRDNVTSNELGLIRNYHKYFKFGVNEMIDYKCPKCKEVTTGPLPFQAEDILYPTVSTDFEELLRSM